MNILIATSKHPIEGQEQDLTDAIKEMATQYCVIVEAIEGMPGPGCYNIAVRATGDEDQCEAFGQMLCIAFGPIAKWCLTKTVKDGFNYSH